jgi:two-component system cell cycle sensor histidine kinase/response regulator CckA
MFSLEYGACRQPDRRYQRVTQILALCAVLVAYFAAAEIALRLAFPAGGATLSWVAAAVLLTAIFLVAITIVGLMMARAISKCRQAESTLQSSQEQLRASEERYRDLFENAQDFIVTVDLQGRFTSANNAVLQVSGFSREDFLNKKILDVVAPGSAELAVAAFKEVLGGSKRGGSQLELVSKDGRKVWVEVSSRRLTQNGAVVGIQSIGRDISWRKRLEQELLHSQKMEAVGRLAGGVAHDFNNLLGVIIGYSDLCLQELGAVDPLRKRIGEIRKAGKRAAEVTKQLLAFSRKQVLTPKVVDLSSLVSETTRMLLRLMGEDIELITKLSPVAARVQTDPAQMQQVIMNLALNARDAMPRGGKLILETATVALDHATGSAIFEELTERGVFVIPGRYVLLAVSDTGTGMDEQTKARIFEPFFTTKQPGEGTGLGLATVYGFVKQSGGYIWVYSEVGRGTTLKIYLPQIQASAEPVEQEASPRLPHGSETVLLVEDEESLRELNQELMEGLGYTVLQAAYGAQALEMAEQHSGQIDLLLTDVVMPGMSGRELAERLAFTQPELKVLYMSGYTDNVIVHHGILKSGIAFLQKPFTRDVLARKLREVLQPSSPKDQRDQ